MKILNQGFDHVEFIVSDIFQACARCTSAWASRKSAARTLPAKGTRTSRLRPGRGSNSTDSIRRLAGLVERQEAVKFLRKHAGGLRARDRSRRRGGRVSRDGRAWRAPGAREPETFQSPEGTVIRAEIWTPADVRYAFVQRQRPAPRARHCSTRGSSSRGSRARRRSAFA